MKVQNTAKNSRKVHAFPAENERKLLTSYIVTYTFIILW